MPRESNKTHTSHVASSFSKVLIESNRKPDMPESASLATLPCSGYYRQELPAFLGSHYSDSCLLRSTQNKSNVAFITWKLEWTRASSGTARISLPACTVIQNPAHHHLETMRLASLLTLLCSDSTIGSRLHSIAGVRFDYTPPERDWMSAPFTALH